MKLKKLAAAFLSAAMMYLACVPLTAAVTAVSCVKAINVSKMMTW